jgi:hypothetical protein
VGGSKPYTEPDAITLSGKMPVTWSGSGFNASTTTANNPVLKEDIVITKVTGSISPDGKTLTTMKIDYSHNYPADYNPFKTTASLTVTNVPLVGGGADLSTLRQEGEKAGSYITGYEYNKRTETGNNGVIITVDSIDRTAKHIVHIVFRR